MSKHGTGKHEIKNFLLLIDVLNRLYIKFSLMELKKSHRSKKD